ncbi:non-hydrolyzing UDP-N-acetylglucosamine 2-epimerase [Desulfogranum japonicum]|uniref:non-hydrolyzing UDP-N-acetylglucosamine 2-epimerase n=1 Tax=Desulfogranum japonicum TaxID=231447 RepID=UPI00048FDFE9|nr:UDP-N-acetylglucosamine 2-epimerase (non-hydrolyzing) [Desulfogranum japonicum]
MDTRQTLRMMSIAGARPNFMKLAAIAHAVEEYNGLTEKQVNIEHMIVHTGQHYDSKMSANFFADLGIPEPDVNLNIGSGSHACQTADIMKAFEPVLLENMPDVLLVVGDVNSTIACSLVASKIAYPHEARHRVRPVIVHVEAGLRSNDRSMPEEINRVLTDAISDFLFVTEQSGLDNLRAEGVAADKMHFAGNVMIDTLINHLEKAKKSKVKENLGVSGEYVVVTLHRPSNVDTKESLAPLIALLEQVAEKCKVVFPVHPRTLNKLDDFSLLQHLRDNENVILSGPLGYLDFLNLISEARAVITDSGGIQEETTYLQVPCITLRENTERPVTVSEGSNYLAGLDIDVIWSTFCSVLEGRGKASRIPDLWDGRSGFRIVAQIVEDCAV